MGPDELSFIEQLRDGLASPSWDLVSQLALPLERDSGCFGEERELALHLRSQIIDLIVAETAGIFLDTSQASTTLTALERRIKKRVADTAARRLSWSQGSPAGRYFAAVPARF
jgi:hypothetical protein